MSNCNPTYTHIKVAKESCLLLSSDYALDQIAKSVKVGAAFTIDQKATNTDTNTSIPADRLQMAIGAGPKLVTGGKVDVDFARDGFDDPLITTKANVRSFAGIDADHRLVVGTVSYCTIEEMANVLAQSGIQDAHGKLINNYLGYIENDVTMVPFRVLLNRLQAHYKWHSDTSTLEITKDKTRIELTPGSTAATVNGQAVQMTAAAQIADGHMYVPLRFVSETLGVNVTWDNNLYRANMIIK